MSKAATAVLLVALGLGVGLWLGFNPQAHAAVQESWTRTSESLVKVQTDLSLKLVGPTEGAAPKQQDSGQAPSGDTASTQVSVALQQFWKATQQLWLNLMARLNI
ncbi:MAG TPA: hypothetical protein VIU38_10860 [Anaerolineales bacterium]